MTIEPVPPPAPKDPVNEVVISMAGSTLIVLACVGGLIASFVARRNPDPAVIGTLGTIGGAAASNLGNFRKGS